jgi:dTDP-4-amino-4,6-dideoxygalactose transaminase
LSEEERRCPEATLASQEILSLPLFAELKKAEIQYIAEAIKKSYAVR